MQTKGGMKGESYRHRRLREHHTQRNASSAEEEAGRFGALALEANLIPDHGPALPRLFTALGGDAAGEGGGGDAAWLGDDDRGGAALAGSESVLEEHLGHLGRFARAVEGVRRSWKEGGGGRWWEMVGDGTWVDLPEPVSPQTMATCDTWGGAAMEVGLGSGSGKGEGYG